MKKYALSLLVVLPILCGLSLPAMATDSEEIDGAEAPAVQAAEKGRGAQTGQFPESFEKTLEMLGNGLETQASGCTAEQYCTHGGKVSCTGNSTCSASTWSCGKVTCDGVKHLCPGGCGGPQQCYYFCIEGQGSQDADCVEGCCVCIF